MRRECGGWRWILLVLAALVAAAALGAAGGCASAPARGAGQAIVPFTPEQQTLFASASKARYRLRVGDTFAVHFKYEDELNQSHVTVLPDGRFTMAGFEDVYALGMTIQELDSLMTAHFARDYRNAELSVIMEELGRSRVYVLGEVRVPGTYELAPGPLNGVLQAVSLAGGLTVNASAGHAVIIRVTEQGWLYRPCDISHLEKSRLADLGAMDLQPNDIVYVPRSALGDWASFADRMLPGLGNLSNFFWDVYAVMHLDRLNFVTR